MLIKEGSYFDHKEAVCPIKYSFLWAVINRYARAWGQVSTS